MAAEEIRKADWKGDAIIAVGVFGLALLTRLLFLFSSVDRAWPHSIWYEGDAPMWVRWAQALARGEMFEFDLPLRTPGVAYLLHWLSLGGNPAGGEVGSPSFLWCKVLWCAMSAAACAAAYLGFRQVFSRRVSLVASALCVFSFGLYVIATSLNNETPYMLVLFTIVWLTLRMMRGMSSSWVMTIVLAALHGAAMLLRAEHALALVLLAAYMAIRAEPSVRVSVRRMAIIMVCGAVVVCLPWTIRGAIAIDRFNTQHEPLPAYEHAQPPWTDEARMMLDALPAFARDGNFQFITYIARQTGQTRVTVEQVEAFFAERFSYVPQPLSRFVFVSNKGALDFALANQIDRAHHGGFSRAALGGDQIEFAFANPDHLRLFNHGYSIGMMGIRDDPPGWLSLVGRKLRRFFDGVALGLTARNLPIGTEGTRYPVDLVTPREGDRRAIAWRIIVFAMLLGGVVVFIVRRNELPRGAGIWLLIIAYKIAVTVLFYGYARQAVSILPAFFVIMALAVDSFGGFRGMKGAFQSVNLKIVASSILAAVLVIEALAAVKPQLIEVRGSIQPAPQWGPSAFEAFRQIELGRAE